MGRGFGRGAAQLGKAVKGKSKERKKDKKTKVKESGIEKNLSDDVKMLEEYEKMNRLAEAQKVRLKKLQQQEAYNTRINRKILTNLARQVMRIEKTQQLRREIDILAQNHERDVARKDAIISMLAKDLDDSEEQFQSAQRGHMDRLRYLIELHEQKLSELESEFERDLKELKNEFVSEKKVIIYNHERQMKEMQNVITAIENEETEKINEAKQAHETEREEIRSKNLEGINELRINLENKIEDLERQFDDAHNHYVANTAQANENFKLLKQEDAKSSLDIYEKKKRMYRLQQNLQSWKKKLEYNTKECTERNNALRIQKEAIAKHCNILKGKMKRFRESEAKRLSELTLMSRNALQSNQVILAQAERLVHLAELSRKMETEREKVTPFYSNTNLSSTQNNSNNNNNDPNNPSATLKRDDFQTQNADNYNNAANNGDSTHHNIQTQLVKSFNEEESAHNSNNNGNSNGNNNGNPSSTSSTGLTALTADGRMIGEWERLNEYYKKYNKVLLDKLAIEQEKKRLLNENAELRLILKQYLDGVAVTADAVDKENPLLIVNGRINLVETQVRRGKPKITQELTHLVQSYAVHGVKT